MAKMSCGKIYVEWYPGEKVEIATVDIDTKGIGGAEIRTRVKKFVFGMAFIRMANMAVYIYAAGLIYSAVIRIITAFRKTAMVYIQ